MACPALTLLNAKTATKTPTGKATTRALMRIDLINWEVSLQNLPFLMSKTMGMAPKKLDILRALMAFGGRVIG